VVQHLPQLAAYFRWAYGGAGPLFSGNTHVADATSGVRQGDPLGPLLFSMALHPALRNVSERFANVCVIAYLDDVFLLGPGAEVQLALETLETESRKAGLAVRREKCQRIERDCSGFLALGTPVGRKEDAERMLSELLEEKAAVLDDLPAFEVRHAFAMLRASVTARPMYWARTVPVAVGEDAFQAFDHAVSECVIRMSGGTDRGLSELAQVICHLPSRSGGLGLRRFSLIREQCWAASMSCAVQTAQQLACLATSEALAGALTLVRRTVPGSVELPNSQPSVDAPVAPVRQKHLLERADKHLWQQTLDALTCPERRAWFLSNSCTESVAWLLEAGAKHHDRAFHNGLVQVALRFKLGEPFLPPPQDGQRLECTCGHASTDVLTFGVHCIGCPRFGQLRSARHNAVRDRVFAALRALKDGAIVEQESAVAADTARRSDVRYRCGGETKHIDVAVCSPATPVALSKGSADNVGIAAALAEEQKKREYIVPLQVAGLQPAALLAAAFETSGRGGEGVNGLLAWINEKARAAGMDAAEHTRRLQRQCAREIWLWNAKILTLVARRSDCLRRAPAEYASGDRGNA